MNWEKAVGPATLIYIVSSTIAGIWWASDLTTRMVVVERSATQSSNMSERLTRLEIIMSRVDTQVERIDNNLRRNPPDER